MKALSVEATSAAATAKVGGGRDGGFDESVDVRRIAGDGEDLVSRIDSGNTLGTFLEAIRGAGRT